MTTPNDIEAQLKALAPASTPTTSKRELIRHKTKQQHREDLLFYGAFGFFSVLLVLFAPLWKKRLEHKLTHKKRLEHER